MPFVVLNDSDHLARIACRAGVAVSDIWDDPRNEELRRLRTNPNHLRGGDVLFVPAAPDADPLQGEGGATNEFTANVPRVPVRLQLRDAEGARSGVSARIVTGPGQHEEVSADGDGVVEVEVSALMPVAWVTVGDDAPLALRVGGLDPSDTLSGVQMRLRQLGLLGAPVTGALDDATGEAIRRLQRQSGLDETGEVDEATLNALREAYGS